MYTFSHYVYSLNYVFIVSLINKYGAEVFKSLHSILCYIEFHLFSFCFTESTYFDLKISVSILVCCCRLSCSDTLSSPIRLPFTLMVFAGIVLIQIACNVRSPALRFILLKQRGLEYLSSFDPTFEL